MSFFKRNKIAVALVAVLAVVGGAAHFSGMTCCDGAPCAITSIFSATTAYAGPGCSASKAGTCDGDSKVKATTASATSAEGKTCTKESCIKAIMAEKNITQAEAEVVYANAMASGSCHGDASKASVTTASASESGCAASKASAQLTSGSTGCSASAKTASAGEGCCASKASAQTASATGCTGGDAKTTASFASATEGKTCADKEACISKCMAEKGLSRAQAEECYAKCSAAKATQANVITGSSFTRDSWIDAKVASGMTRPEAEVAAAKAEASGDVKFVSATGCSASKASATGGTCCASKAGATTAKVEETKPAVTTTSASTGGSN